MATVAAALGAARVAVVAAVGNCIKIGFPGKSILRDYFQENRTSPRPSLLLRICFPGRPIFIQFVPDQLVLKDNLSLNDVHTITDSKLGF